MIVEARFKCSSAPHVLFNVCLVSCFWACTGVLRNYSCTCLQLLLLADCVVICMKTR